MQVIVKMLADSIELAEGEVGGTASVLSSSNILWQLDKCSLLSLFVTPVIGFVSVLPSFALLPFIFY